MSMNELFNLAGAKPKQITPYTTGTGTYTPTVDMARCFVRVQAGGGGGSTIGGGAGGGGGAMVEAWIRIPIAGLTYVVGGGGAANTNGSNSTFGRLMAMGGFADTGGTGVGGYGGLLTILAGGVNATNATVTGNNSFSGVSGGQGGGPAVSGLTAGLPIGYGSAVISPLTNISTRLTNGQGNLSGGDSFFGRGGVTQASPAAGNYGAGGGGGASPAAGLGGYIEIWDFGA